jgi:dTDP-4-amino-4,6-dideoxygalactose transaminase
LENIPGIKLLRYNEKERCNYQYIVLEIDQTLTHLSRDKLVEILHAENVLARRYFYPGCHRVEPYRTCYPEAKGFLPETEKLTECVLCLPTGSAVESNQIEMICHIVRLAIAHGSELSQFLARRPSTRHCPKVQS